MMTYDEAGNDDDGGGGGSGSGSGSGNCLSRSFETKTNRFTPRTTEEGTKWVCVSPMTKHVFLRDVTKSPVNIRRRRSRSFNDYIDSRENEYHEYHQQHRYRRQGQRQYEHGNLLLPSLRRLSTASPIGGISSGVGKGRPPPPEDPAPERVESAHGKHNPDDNAGNGVENGDNSALICIMYGMINATIVLPVVMSFGNIIYRDDAFAAYTPVLIKLTLISGVVHQLSFSTFSSFPFAVGSVQDAGLIFLSSMAKDMVVYCRAMGHDDETMLATVTVGLGAATALLGLGLVVIATLRLAGYVQLLPTCVVAGYLAYIGWFCGKSGIALMAGASELTFSRLVDNLHLVAPGLFGGVFIYGSVRKLRHVAVLPTCICILLVFFYAGLGATGSSIEQATANGWIRESAPAPIWYHTWDYLKLNKVAWSALPQLLLTESSMIFVVALSSSLDIAAIELELKRPLNYDSELMMVGMSNVISGLTGGYTGSYIFSQTIFTLRSGIRSRLAGYVLALCQLIVIVAPFPILAYVPNFFYGSLLGMICLDLMNEWLFQFYWKVGRAEYVIGLSTFFFIQFIGVEYGILAGLTIYIVCGIFGIDVGEVSDVALDLEEEIDVEHTQPPEATPLVQSPQDGYGLYI